MDVFNTAPYEKLFQSGLLHMTLPKRHGGPERTVVEMADILKAIGGSSAGVATSVIGNTLGLSAAMNFGSEALIQAITEDCMRNFCLWSFAMTEKCVGSDVKNIRTRADLTSEGYVLNGEKNYITNGAVSKYLSVFAQTYDQNGKHKGVSCFLVKGDSTGLERGTPLVKVAFQESNTAHVYFENVLVPKECLLGSEGQGLKILQKCISQSKTLFAAVGVGISHKALAMTEEYLKNTPRFGKPLIENPVITHLLVRLHTETEAAWLLTKKAAETWDHLRIATVESSMAKLMAGVTATKVTSECMELFAANSMLAENEMHRLYTDAKGVEIIEGTGRIQELIISHQLFRAAKPATNLSVTPTEKGVA